MLPRRGRTTLSCEGQPLWRLPIVPIRDQRLSLTQNFMSVSAKLLARVNLRPSWRSPNSVSRVGYGCGSCGKDLHHLVAKVIDHLDGDTARGRPREGTRSVAVKRFPGV